MGFNSGFKGLICLSVRPSLGSHGTYCTEFHEIRNPSIFRKSVAKIQVALQSDKNIVYFT